MIWAHIATYPDPSREVGAITQAQAAAFYTGLVADLYSPLKSTSFDPSRYSKLIDQYGEPALELGCGDGDPLLDLRADGYDVDGLDSSPDMIDRLHRRARERTLDVTAWVAAMEAMARALMRIHDALDPEGTAIVPVFVPDPISPQVIGVPHQQATSTGSIAWQILAAHRDEQARTQTLTLRYERECDGYLERTERNWILHWIDRVTFENLARDAGLTICATPETIDGDVSDIVLRR